MESRLLLDVKKQRDDLRLLHMAAKRWDIPQRYRQRIIERLFEVVDGDDDEMSIKAIAEFRHLESQNQKDEHKLIDVHAETRNAELSAIAADLGIEEATIIDVTIEAGGSIEGASQCSSEVDRVRTSERH